MFYTGSSLASGHSARRSHKDGAGMAIATGGGGAGVACVTGGGSAPANQLSVSILSRLLDAEPRQTPGEKQHFFSL